MPSLFIRHTVVDFAAWRPAFEEHGFTRRANGSQRERIFRNADDPNEVMLLLEWDDLSRARLFIDSDDLREAMERAGVTGRPDIWFLVDGDHKPA
jgi:heme-degrading monooxygenase HmoA